MRISRRKFTQLSVCTGMALMTESFLPRSVRAAAGSGSLETAIVAGTMLLEKLFQNPTGEGAPVDSQLGTFWFWANTVTKEGITRDLEAMKQTGIGRAVLGMTRYHSATIETGGVVFLSPEWLALFRYALDEADRLGIKISAVMSNGWYQGAPWVTPEIGAQKLVWSETLVTGLATTVMLPVPDQFRKGPHAGISKKAKGHFQSVAVLAFRQNGKGELVRDSLVRLDDRMKPDGTLDWPVPAGRWRVFRFAHIPNFVPMKQDSPGFTGLQIDHLSAKTMELFFNKVGLPLLNAAGPHVGKTLDFFHEDSIELGSFDWTSDFPEQFAARRHYDLIPWLPVLAGKTFAGEPQVFRVEHDFLETVDELLADEHYGTFHKLCHKHGIKLETEGGDVNGSLRVKGETDLPMGEFWNLRYDKKHPRYVENSNNLLLFNPNTVIASHIYGQNRVSFESFTSRQHWMEYPAMLKPLADEVYCLGVNHLTLHGYSYSRPETPMPGDVYFAGTHFNPGVTWWKYAGGFFSYLNRCQVMLLAGSPVVDILYVDGQETQKIIRENESRSLTALGKCDAIPGGLLVEQLKVLPDGRVGLSNGLSYVVLAVANATVEPAVLQKTVQLVKEGATVWFRTVPQQAPGWTGYPGSDKMIASCLKELGADRPAGVYKVGNGKLILGDIPVKDLLARIGLAPAFDYTPDDGKPFLDYIQRQDGDTDIFFVANWKDAWHRAECACRVADKQPEFWDPVTGEISPCPQYQVGKGVVRFVLKLPPHASTFVVFRKKSEGNHGKPLPVMDKISGQSIAITTLAGPWRIEFQPGRESDPKFEVTSPALFFWNESSDVCIKSFSGTASYQTTFDVSPKDENSKWILDLGVVHDLAEVLVNGKPAGVVWTPPFSVDITQLLQPGKNILEIHVVNTWHNWRLANKFTAGTHPWEKEGLSLPPAPAGLTGPVTLQTTK